MTKRLCFRFDIDTHKCAGVGIPNLLQLAREKNVKFAFMVNCGKAIHLPLAIASLFQPKAKNGPPMLSPRRKLGNLDYLRCALQNPSIFDTYSEVFAQAQREGHEIGLHGGRNHEIWAKEITHWDDRRVREEIEWGLQKLSSQGITPTVFASPCAVGGERLRRIAQQFSCFRYVSDRIAPGVLKLERGPGLPDIPVPICGEGGTAFIEAHVAMGHSPGQIDADFRSRLSSYPTQTVYDHPYFAGIEALPITARLIDVARAEGFEFVHLSEIGDAL
jgi:hypothetical protein